MTEPMTSACTLTTDLPQPLSTAIETRRAALTARLGLDSDPQRQLGICRPKVAHAIPPSAQPDMGAVLPCGCGVSETSPGATRIALQRVVARLANGTVAHAVSAT